MDLLNAFEELDMQEEESLQEKLLTTERGDRFWYFDYEGDARNFIVNNAFHFKGIRVSEVKDNIGNTIFLVCDAHDLDHWSLCNALREQGIEIKDELNNFRIGYPNMMAFNDSNFELDVGQAHDNNKLGSTNMLTIEEYEDFAVTADQDIDFSLVAKYPTFCVSINSFLDSSARSIGRGSLNEVIARFKGSELYKCLGKEQEFFVEVLDGSGATIYEECQSLTEDREPEKHYFNACQDLLKAWSQDKELTPLLKYFTLADKYRVAILYDDIKAYRTLPPRLREEFLKMLSYIIGSKYNRNETDAGMTYKERVNVFYSVAKKEEAILKCLQTRYPEYGFRFNGKDFNGINEHYYLFSGWYKGKPDLVTNIGPEVSTEIFIEIKPAEAISNENDHLADFVLRYNNSQIWLEDFWDCIELFREQSPRLDPSNPYDNKKLYGIELYDALSHKQSYR